MSQIIKIKASILLLVMACSLINICLCDHHQQTKVAYSCCHVEDVKMDSPAIPCEKKDDCCYDNKLNFFTVENEGKELNGLKELKNFNAGPLSWFDADSHLAILKYHVHSLPWMTGNEPPPLDRNIFYRNLLI